MKINKNFLRVRACLCVVLYWLALSMGPYKWLVLQLAALVGEQSPLFSLLHPFPQCFTGNFWFAGHREWLALAHTGLGSATSPSSTSSVLQPNIRQRSGHSAKLCWLLLNPNIEMRKFCRLFGKIKIDGDRLVFGLPAQPRGEPVAIPQYLMTSWIQLWGCACLELNVHPESWSWVYFLILQKHKVMLVVLSWNPPLLNTCF